MNEDSYVSRSFTEFIGQVDYKKYYIGNFVYQQDEYKNIYQKEYLNALNLLSKGSISYENFYTDFGTYLIGNYIVGDRLYIDTYVMSNNINIDSSVSYLLTSDFSSKLSSSTSSSKTISSLLSSYGISRSNSVFDSFDLAIVWRASGNGNDTWYNKNTSVSYKIYNI